MAEGPWVPAFDSIWTHPKTRRFGQELKLDQERAAAKFLKLCAWLRDRAESGDLADVDAAGAAQAVGLRAGGGVSMAQRGGELMAALKASGLVTDDARAHVVGWEDGPGRMVASRREDRLRKAHQRGQHGAGIVRGCPRCEESGKAQETVRGSSGQAQSTLRKGQPDPLSAGQKLSGSTLSPGQEAKPRTNGLLHADMSPGHDPSPATVSGVEGRTRQTEHVPPPPDTSAKPRATGPLTDPRTEAELLIGTAQGTWHDVLERIRAQLPSAQTFVTWYARTRLEEHAPGQYVVIVPNNFAMEWLRSKYATMTRDALIEVTKASRLSVTFALAGGPREPDVIEDVIVDDRPAGGGG